MSRTRSNIKPKDLGARGLLTHILELNRVKAWWQKMLILSELLNGTLDLTQPIFGVGFKSENQEDPRLPLKSTLSLDYGVESLFYYSLKEACHPDLYRDFAGLGSVNGNGTHNRRWQSRNKTGFQFGSPVVKNHNRMISITAFDEGQDSQYDATKSVSKMKRSRGRTATTENMSAFWADSEGNIHICRDVAVSEIVENLPTMEKTEPSQF